MFCVYVLKNEQGKYYIGFSEKSPEQRVVEHNQGKSQWTRGKGPWRIVHFEIYPTKQEAFKRERQIKSYKGGRAFRSLVEAK